MRKLVQRPAKYEVALKKGAKGLSMGLGGKPSIGAGWKKLELSPGEYLVIVSRFRKRREYPPFSVIVEVRGGVPRKYEVPVKDLIPLTEHAKNRLLGQE